MIDIILWILLIFAIVVFIVDFAKKNPDVLDVDVTDPLGIFSVEDVVDNVEDVITNDVCEVCERKKGSEPLLICQDEKCINKSETH